ncbi:type II toxin-antitoxin system RatA family toxin [Providencia alcalifaciens]|nr:type II toxin-antitoxin system RatA family toxin [Providencia alcalifaciens]NYS89440.1 type II toxin-antitoxin system RatA family toxin [Providencia alcalifaciens]QLQ99321.1 type II toxin-antitoxin system RatA family toxin [Providencia alcalifaciens]
MLLYAQFLGIGIDMPQISRSALVPFSAEQMYKLVNDVISYPSFLPGCVGSRIISHSSDEMTASVEVSKAGISKTFITKNALEDNKRIQMQLVEGPFRTLSGGWQFIPLSADACKIEFHLDFEFTNKLIELAFGKIFKELANNMVQAFTSRAKVVYRV